MCERIKTGPLIYRRGTRCAKDHSVVRRDKMLTDPDSEKSSRVMKAMMQMHKLDIAGLQQAYAAA